MAEVRAMTWEEWDACVDYIDDYNSGDLDTEFM